MTMISYKRKILNIVENYGRGKPAKSKQNACDILITTDLLLDTPSGPLLKKHKHHHSFEIIIPNFFIDLRKSETELFKTISKHFRADIKKGLEKDNFYFIEYEEPTNEQLLEFTLLFNKFAKEKKLAKCLVEKLIAIRDEHSLLLTSVTDERRNVLCAHCMLLEKDSSFAYGIYSFSSRIAKDSSKERRLIGRANKCLHWKEMQFLKGKGYSWYDMGGFVNGEAGKGINEFKLKFGADKGCDQKIYQANSLIGKLLTALLYLKWKRNLASTHID